MEQLTTNGGDLETSAVKLAFPHQVMIEKWMLVLLIVGCTSLGFLICFPIDFYLYRRRKRLARERKNIITFRPQQTPKRVAPCQAKMTVTNVYADTDYSEINEVEQRRYRAQRGVIRFLNMLKQKRAETLELQERLAENTLSERSSELHLTTMLEVKKGTTDNHGNSYKEMNDNTPNLTHCVNELTRRPEEKTTHQYLYDDDYFDYSPEKRFPKASKARNDNQEVFNYRKKRSHLGARYDKKMSQLDEMRKSQSGAHHKKKKSRFRALEPLENMTNVLEETCDNNCFTIPNCRRNEEHLEPVNIADENYKEISHNKSNNEHSLESNTVSSAAKLTGNDTDAALTSDDKSEGFCAENLAKDVHNNTAKLFQTVFDAEDQIFKSHKILAHSQSEQCIIGNFSHSKRSHKKKRKRNVVSPVSEDTSSFSEQFYSEANVLNDRKMPITVPVFSEYAVTPKVKRKLKKNTFWKKQCSMPELHYEKEKY
ncbi:uncharacterized protein LOC123534696 [Mercenaria mercenaria]|uniref:uncharacterized protein LOC123534696 n=1 Tax=Mercenaria mercenaria TaxID=6596 RepID=UPI00234EC973|nr:uncharacterized protein LOC123534696 [Mercenaria mercenaria]